MRWKLLPQLCLLCRCWVPAGSAMEQLCGYCLAELPWNADACAVCGLPPGGCDGNCTPDLLHRVVSPLRYEGSASRWVVRGKRLGGGPELRLLGTLLAQAVTDAYEPTELPDVLLPVPLSRRRLGSRGHNQALLLAQPVRRLTGLPIDRVSVRRVRHTPIQPGYRADDRLANVAGAFRSRRRWDGMRVAVIDDVVTSGATAREVAGCLRAAGASEVHCWCATRAAPS